MEDRHPYRHAVMSHEPIDNLAIAIVKRALTDYILALRALRKNPREGAVRNRVWECEVFFSSPWCGVLVEMDMEDFARRIRERVSREEKRNKKRRKIKQ
jgi:hypothetical protein